MFQRFNSSVEYINSISTVLLHCVSMRVHLAPILALGTRSKCPQTPAELKFMWKSSKRELKRQAALWALWARTQKLCYHCWLQAWERTASERCSDPAGEEEHRIKYPYHCHTGMDKPPAMTVYVTLLTGNRGSQKNSMTFETFSPRLCKIWVVLSMFRYWHALTFITTMFAAAWLFAYCTWFCKVIRSFCEMSQLLP